uniref:hypothetical protein n=1 Tax=Brachyspira catarrhinii TaxID=2528966 RepID=UPI003F4C80ED
MGRNGKGDKNIETIENTSVYKINYGEHRRKYKEELKKLMLDIKEGVNTENVLKFYVLLKNYGIYSDDNIDSAYKYFEKNDKKFFEKLEAYLSDLNNKRKVSNALELILKCINNIRDFSSNGFYKDLLDDLKAECGLMIGTSYNNFIEPSIYTQNNIFKEDSSIVEQIIKHNQTESNEHFEGDDIFEHDGYEEIRKNKAINKKMMKAVKGVR